MQPVRYIFTPLFILGTLFSGWGQNSGKPAFKKIEFAIYDYNSELSELRDKADISYYLIIDEKRNAKVQVGKQPAKVYTMTLSDSVIKQIAAFFTGDMKPDDYKIKEELEAGTYYAASYRYISITYANNSKSSLCYIRPIMSDLFNEFIDQLPDIDTKKNINPNAKTLITPAVTKTITDLHKKSKNLPEFKSPPPQ